MVSISAYHAEDPGSIPGGGVCTALLLLALLPPIGAQLLLRIFQEGTPGFEAGLEAMESAIDAIESGAKQTLG